MKNISRSHEIIHFDFGKKIVLFYDIFTCILLIKNRVDKKEKNGCEIVETAFSNLSDRGLVPINRTQGKAQ